MGKFEEIASDLVIHRLKATWLLVEKFYNELATKNDGSLAMSFVLLAINNEKGSPVTSIAPRIGMEPNSLSRILKTLIEKEIVYKRNSTSDKRKVYICLTPLGLERQAMVLEKLFSLENGIKSDLSQEDLDGFFKVTSQIVKYIEKLKMK